jgi:cell division protein FtsL
MIRTSSVLFWFGLAIIASIALYRTSDHVQALNHQLSSINSQIEFEQQSLHVLKAEWVYLSNPARLEKLAQKHLALRLTSPQQITTADNLSTMLPTRNEAMASVSVSSTPIANVRVSMAAPSPQGSYQAAPNTVRVMKMRQKTTAPKPLVTLASTEPSHLNDHMLIQHTASAESSADQIGAMLAQLDRHP